MLGLDVKQINGPPQRMFYLKYLCSYLFAWQKQIGLAANTALTFNWQDGVFIRHLSAIFRVCLSFPCVL